MITTEQFYESFDKAGFLKTALWTPSAGGAQQSAKVRFHAPTDRPLGGELLVTDYSIRYPSSVFPGLKRGEVLTVAGQPYTVREGPVSLLDGSELEVKLAKG